MDPMRAKKRKEAFHEPSEVPPDFGVRRQSVAATPLCIGPLPRPESSLSITRLARRIQSGVALCFPPHSKTLARWQCRRANRKRQSAGAVQDVTARSTGSWSQCIRKNERGLHERGSAVVERNRFRADQVNAAVYSGQIYRRAALAEFAVKILPDGKVFFRLEGKIAADSPGQRVR